MTGMRQRVEELEKQVFTLSSFILAIGELLEEKNVFTKADLHAVSSRVSEARLRGFSYEEARRFKSAADRLFIPDRK